MRRHCEILLFLFQRHSRISYLRNPIIVRIKTVVSMYISIAVLGHYAHQQVSVCIKFYLRKPKETDKEVIPEKDTTFEVVSHEMAQNRGWRFNLIACERIPLYSCVFFGLNLNRIHLTMQ